MLRHACGFKLANDGHDTRAIQEWIGQGLNRDRDRGFFEATDEKGNPVRVPLTTLSLAVINSRALGDERHPAIFSQLAAGFKQTAKAVTAALGRSGFATNDWGEGLA